MPPRFTSSGFATLECPSSNAGDVVGDRHAGQAGTFKRIISDAGDSVANRRGQVVAILERRLSNAGDVIGNDVLVKAV